MMILGIASWFFAIVEMISVQSFNKFFFRIGIPVFRRTIDVTGTHRAIELNNTIKKSVGKFRFTSPNTVYFLSQTFWFRMFRITTPFPLRAIGTIIPDNKIEIVGRVPLGTTLFILFWLLAWTSGSFSIAALTMGNFSGVGFGLFGWAFAGLLIAISNPIEMGRMETMIKELREIVTEPKVI